ncbi:MAG: type IV pilus secretin PilQ [Acidobacteriota bacterium]
MRFGKVAILMAFAAAALRCSGHPPVSDSGQVALDAPAAVVINQIDHTATASGTEVVLRGNYPFSYTSYQPDPRTLILELIDVRVQDLASEIRIDSPQVENVLVKTIESVDGGVIAKFEFHNVLASQHAIRLEGHDLIVDFPSLADSENLPEPPLIAALDEVDEAPQEVMSPLLEEDWTPAEPEPPLGDEAEEADGEAGPLRALEEVGPEAEAAPEAGDVDPVLDQAPPVGEDGPEPPSGEDQEEEALLLEVPEPLPDEEPALERPAPPPAGADGETLRVTRGPAPVGTPGASLFRVEVRESGPLPLVVLTADGQLEHEHFELQDPPRLVIDLLGVVNRAGTSAIPVTSDFLTRVRVAQFASRPRPISRVVLDMSGPRPYAIVPTETGLVVNFSEQAVRHAVEDAPPPQEPIAQTLAAEMPAGSPPDAVPAAAGTPQEVGAAPEEGPAQTGVSGSSNPLLAMGEVKVERRGQEVDFRPLGASSEDSTTLIAQGTGRFGARSISDTGPKYTGKRISLNFKDADLKDVFRLFHEITGYNIVLDPGVSGTLTIVLENVPEDQALDIILKNNGLDKVFENNVIRIATTQKLASEAAARKALLEAKELEEEPITFTRSLSYAKAKDVTPIIKKIMSKRGDVIMDDRTNTLIITDLRNRREPINRLIDALDEQTPQVVIEARIVETDREFERDLGIIWGVHGEASVAKGTQTNLQFPHTATVDYDVSLPSAATAGTLGLSFGNVLDSVTLDMTLEAFELNGDVKVLSSPRIATQNNQKAVIEQGTQIPVVSTTATQINVEYISASLKLEVTPQITKERTVIMDVRVENSSPDFVNRVGDVPPIITERAETQILVTDGGTAVIGGIFKMNDSITEASVPGLSKIPGLGWLFRSKSINRKNTELLIFITPRIVKKAVAQEVEG